MKDCDLEWTEIENGTLSEQKRRKTGSKKYIKKSIRYEMKYLVQTA